MNWVPALAGYRTSSVALPKVVIQYIRKLSLPRRIVAALDGNGDYYPLNNYSYCFLQEGQMRIEYILGVLNSWLVNFYYANSFIDYNIKPTYLKRVPIRTIDFSDPADVKKHGRMVALVERMLELHKRRQEARTPDEKTMLDRQIAATDREIDELVYELYGLTEEEIRIVEGR